MLLTLSKFFLYTSLASVIIVMPSTFFPFIGGKYYFFRFTVQCAFAFLLLWWAWEDTRSELYERIKYLARQPLFVAVSLFVFFYILASLLADNPSGAFWSNYERGEGGFQMLHYYVFFVLLALLFRSAQEWRRAFFVSCIAGAAMIFYGLGAVLHIPHFVGPYQGRSPDTSAWEALVSGRFQGSLGNPAYVAPYLMFIMAYAFYLWRDKLWERYILQVSIYGGLLVFFLFFFLLSQTRGAYLGLLALGVAFLFYVFFAWRKSRKWVGIVGISLFLTGSFLVSARHVPFVESLPGARMLALADLGIQDRTIQTRLWTWGSALRGIKERPLLGWGPENFSTVFDKYFDPRHYVPETNSETWFDRAHNVFFDYLVTTGVIGVLAYLGMFLVYYLLFFKRVVLGFVTPHEAVISRAAYHFQNAILFALPIGYLVQGLALFDVLPIYLNLFLFFAFANFLFSYYAPQGERQKHP